MERVGALRGGRPGGSRPGTGTRLAAETAHERHGSPVVRVDVACRTESSGSLSGMINGDNYLNYASIIAHDSVRGHEWGILLVEAGVLITVSSTMIAIFYTFAERSRA